MEHPNPADFDVVWRPHPGSQTLVLAAPVNDILYCGTRGPGKTDAQLMRFRRLVGAGYGPFWRGIIFDREYKNLDDLITKSKRWFYALDSEAQFLSSNSDLKWRWPTGEELLFRQIKRLDDYWSYHGHEYPFIGWNELTKYPTLELYQKMFSVNRSGFDPEANTPRLQGDNYVAEWNRLHPNGHHEGREFRAGDYETPDGRPLPPIPLETFATCNPYGPGHNAVKRQFIDAAPYGKVIRNTIEVFNPQTKREEPITRTQVTVFGSYKENPNLDPQYIAGIHKIDDENVKKAWLTGDWDIVAGGALDDKWRRAVHVIKRFKIPANWHVDRALDWGSSHPFSVGWFAEANGEEVELDDGSIICPQPGTIIQIAEWYGTKSIGTNIGLKLSAKDVAKGIKKVENALIDGGWITKRPYPGPADNQISNVVESETDTIEKKMGDEGIRWTKSDKSAGTRAQGLQLIRDRLEASITQEGAGLLIMDNCRATIATVPILPRDEKNMDVVDTDAEDHVYDMLRYRVLAGNNRLAKAVVINFPR